MLERKDFPKKMIISKCARCKQLSRKLLQQKTEDLVKGRMSEEPPFMYYDTDLFGLFIVKMVEKKLTTVC